MICTTFSAMSLSWSRRSIILPHLLITYTPSPPLISRVLSIFSVGPFPKVGPYFRDSWVTYVSLIHSVHAG